MYAMLSYVREVPDATPAELIAFAIQTSRRAALRGCPAKLRQKEVTASIQLKFLQNKLRWLEKYLTDRDGGPKNA